MSDTGLTPEEQASLARIDALLSPAPPENVYRGLTLARERRANLQEAANLQDAPTGVPTPLEQAAEYFAPAPQYLRDLGIATVKGGIGLAEAAVGVTDISSLGLTGKLLQESGVDLAEAQRYWSNLRSDAGKQREKRFQDTEDWVEAGKALLTDPSLIAEKVVESLPASYGGAIVGKTLAPAATRASSRLVPKLFPKATKETIETVGRAAAFGAGEGLVTAGSTAESVRQQTADGLLTPGQAAISAGTGALTGVIGAASAGVAKRLGITNLEEWLAGANPASKRSFFTQVVGNMATEGLIEEWPQSYQEAVAENLALGRPWNEGAAVAGVTGAIVGAATGAGIGAVSASQGAANRARQDQIKATQDEIERVRKLYSQAPPPLPPAAATPPPLPAAPKTPPPLPPTASAAPLPVQPSAPVTGAPVPAADVPMGGGSSSIAAVPTLTVPSRPADFTTAKGSQYWVDERGHTTRLKQSAGKGQGKVHEASPVVFLSPGNATVIQEEMMAGGRIVVEDATGAQLRPDSSTDVRSKTGLRVVVRDRASGKERVSVPAFTEAAVGFQPFEIRYDGDQKHTHLGNQITRMAYKAPVAAPVAVPAPTSVPAAPVVAPAAPPQPRVGTTAPEVTAGIWVGQINGAPDPKVRKKLWDEAVAKVSSKDEAERAAANHLLVTFSFNPKNSRVGGPPKVAKETKAAKAPAPTPVPTQAKPTPEQDVVDVDLNEALPDLEEAPVDPWPARFAKAKSEGLSVQLESEGETATVRLTGAAAVKQLRTTRDLSNSLRALLDCLGGSK